MKQYNVLDGLPEGYFDDKNSLKFRFYVLDDIAHASGHKPRLYDSTDESHITSLYDEHKDVALYVHLPWCRSRCNYCYYHQGKIDTDEKIRALIQAEKHHAMLLDDKIGLRHKNVPSIYFGGGTPTAVPEELMEDCISFFVNRYASTGCEVCCESSPYTLSPRKLDILEKYVTRLSIGVQSFDATMLRTVNRKPLDGPILELMKDAVSRFPSVNADLIYGLRNQTPDKWFESVQKIIDLGVPSITAYRLEIRDATPIAKIYLENPEQFPDELTCQTMYMGAKEMFLKAGYRENLVGWFLLPKVSDTKVYRERWEKQTPCIAFGPDVHNYGADHFYDTLADKEAYISAVMRNRLPIEHIYDLSGEQRLLWYVLAQWKSNKPVYKEAVRNLFGDQMLEGFLVLLQDYLGWGILVESNETIDMTETAKRIIDWMLADIISAGIKSDTAVQMVAK